MESEDLKKKLLQNEANLANVEAALVTDPGNEQYIELRCAENTTGHD